MKQQVTLQSLRQILENRHCRDSWHLARNGQVLERPLSLDLIVKTTLWDPESTFQILHSDEAPIPVEQWTFIVPKASGRLPAKGREGRYSGVNVSVQGLQQEIDDLRGVQGQLLAELSEIRHQLGALQDRVVGGFRRDGMRMEVMGTV